MSSTSASYLHLTMATHAGRNLMFGIDHKRAIYYAVQRAKPKIETTGFRLDPVDLETLKHQGLEGRDKLRPMLGKLYADEPKYLEALGKQLEAKVVDTHKSKLLAAARQTKTLIWHDWRFLELPHEPADESVTKREKADGTDSLICSLYNSHKDSASAGVQAVSSGEQLHVFRQSIRGTLLVDRFVLDLETNRLNRALEVRFRRSRKRYTPLASTSDTTLDSCDFRDADGKFFLAPSLELRMVENLSGGQFSVVVTPTQDHERARWHIFAWDSKAGHFRVTSLRSQKAGGFDVYDHTIVEGAAVHAKYRQVAGVICTNLTLKGPQNQVLTPSAPPSATRYDVQRKVEGNDGKSQVLRVARRVMLAVPTGSDGKVVTVSFAVHTDGTLSRVAGTPVDKLRAEKNESILLPADLLNRVDTRSASAVESPPAVARHGLHFNADGTCVANAAAPMDLKGRSFTIEFWARRRESNRTAFVFRQGPYGTRTCLHIGFRANNVFTFAFYADDLNAPPAPADTKWHHWCCTYDHDTRMRFIYRDGVEVAKDKASGPYLGHGAPSIGRSDQHHFGGDLADLRVWSSARTAAEVKANLAARLTGREYQLMACWPLLAVEDGHVRNLVAQSPKIACRGLYPAHRTITPLLRDGNTRAVNFESRTLVAAVERSTFSETVEFKGDASGLEFLYWGKKIGGAQTAKVPVKAQITNLEGGWKRASARFTVPHGLTHLRAFDLRVLGQWSKLELRDHKLQRLSSTITQRVYTETLVLPIVAAEHASHVRGRASFELQEQEVARLRQEHAVREAALNRSPAQNTAAVTQKRNQVTNLRNQANQATARRAEMERCLTYGGVLAIRGNNGHNNNYLRVAGQSVHCDAGAVGPWEKFVIVNAQNQGSEEAVHYGDWVGLRAHTGKFLIAGNASAHHTHYYWLEAEWPHIKSYEKFQVLNPDNLNDRGAIASTGGLAFRTNRRDHGLKFVRTSTGGAWWNKVWCEGTTVDAGAKWAALRQTYGPGVAKAQGQEAVVRSLLSAAEAELARLEKVAADAANERQRLGAERDDYRNRRTAAETQLATARQKLGAQGAAPHAMTTLTPDGRKDTVAGAILGFARTFVRPEVRESMDGNVMLQFPDVDGRLRVCRHDTLTEKWHTGDQASCLRNQSGHASMRFHQRYQLTTMTIEVWFKWEGQASDIGFLTSRGLEELEIHTAGEGGPGSLRFIPVPGVFIDTAPNAITPGEWTHVACVFREEVSSGEIYINGVAATHVRKYIKRDRAPTSSGFHVGCRTGGVNTVRGQFQELRLWNAALSAEEIRGGMHFEASGHEPGLVGYWPMTEGSGSTAHDRSSAANHATLHGTSDFYPAHTSMGRIVDRKALSFGANGKVTGLGGIDIANKSFTVELWARCKSVESRVQGLLFHGVGNHNSCLHLVFMPGNKFSCRFWNNDLDLQTATDTRWHHWACVYDRAQNLRTIYCDGVQMAQDRPQAPYQGAGGLDLGHWRDPNTSFPGLMSDVRFWSVAKSQAQIKQTMHSRLRGDEPGLQAYFKLDGIVGNKLRDRSGALVGNLVDTKELAAESLPIASADALLGGEYSSVEQASGKNVALLRRQYAWLSGGETYFATGQRVDTLEMRWLGNAQTKPTLVGYIEGAPPVPSENLTVESDYREASSVELKVNESVATTYEQTFATGLDSKLTAAYGWASNTSLGVALGASATETLEISLLGQLQADAAVRGRWDFSRSGSTTHTTSDKLSLKGVRELKPQFANLGLRYTPKNVGYATIISSIADVFVLRLRSSKRVVNYRVTPVKDIPPDINTITFMINPAYTLNGTLDGQIGSEAADKQFYGSIPMARAQYGSAVESSYFRLAEAYALRDAVERSNRSLEAIAVNLRADLLDKTRSTKNTQASKDKQAVADKSKEAKTAITDKQRQAAAAAAKRPSVDELIAKIPKGNIVNNYVWDGDGGLRGQTQAFATSWKHVLGGSFSVDVGIGAKGEIKGAGMGAEFDYMLSAHLSMSFNNTTEHTRAIELNVELKPENRDITDNQDRPLHPGEKVDRYRFMSFALQASTDHFNEFFDRVVDPVWLRSNDEEAVVLRQLDRGKPNQAWRVLHRVTYVERPSTGSK